MIDPKVIVERPCSSWMLENVVTGDVHRLRLGRTTIGSHRRSDIRSCKPYVDRHHAEIDVSLDDDTVIVRDLDTGEGTFVNSTRIQNQEAILEVGDCIGLGVDSYFAKSAMLEIPVYNVKFQPMKALSGVDIKPALPTYPTGSMCNPDTKPVQETIAPLKPPTVASDFVIVIDDDDEEESSTVIGTTTSTATNSTTETKSCSNRNATENNSRLCKEEMRPCLPDSVLSAEKSEMSLVHMPKITQAKQEVITELTETVTDIFGEADENIFNHMKEHNPYVYNELLKQVNRSPKTQQPRLFDKDIVDLDDELDYYFLEEPVRVLQPSPPELQSPPPVLQSPPPEFNPSPSELQSPPPELQHPGPELKPSLLEPKPSPSEVQPSPPELQSPTLVVPPRTTELQSPTPILQPQPPELHSHPRELEPFPSPLQPQPACAPPAPQIINNMPLMSPTRSNRPEQTITKKIVSDASTSTKAKQNEPKREDIDCEKISPKGLKRSASPRSTESQKKIKLKSVSDAEDEGNQHKKETLKSSRSSPVKENAEKRKRTHHSSSSEKSHRSDHCRENRESETRNINKKHKSNETTSKKHDLKKVIVKIEKLKADTKRSGNDPGIKKEKDHGKKDKVKSPLTVSKSYASPSEISKKEKAKRMETFNELFGDDGDNQNESHIRMSKETKSKGDDAPKSGEKYHGSIKSEINKNMESRKYNYHESGHCAKNKAATNECTEAHAYKAAMPSNRSLPLIIEAPHLPKWKGKLRGVSAVPKSAKSAVKKRVFQKLKEQRKERLQKLAAAKLRTNSEPSTPSKRHSPEEGEDPQPIKIRLTRVESSESNSNTPEHEYNTYRSTIMTWAPEENLTDQNASDTTTKSNTDNTAQTPSSPKASPANFYLPIETSSSPKKSVAPTPKTPPKTPDPNDTVPEKPFVRTAVAKISYRTVNKVTFASVERNYSQNRALDEKLETLSKQRLQNSAQPQSQPQQQKSSETSKSDKKQNPKINNISRLLHWGNSTLPGHVATACDPVMPIRNSGMWNIRANFLKKLKENNNEDAFRAIRMYFTVQTERLNLTVLCEAKKEQLELVDKFSLVQVFFNQGGAIYALVVEKDPIIADELAVLKLELLLGKNLTHSYVLASEDFVVRPMLADIRLELWGTHDKDEAGTSITEP